VAVELRNYVASSLAVHSEYKMSQMQSSLWYFFKLVVLLSSFVLRASLNEMYITEIYQIIIISLHACTVCVCSGIGNCPLNIHSVN
jgi:hypothetical protein